MINIIPDFKKVDTYPESKEKTKDAAIKRRFL